MFFRMRASNIIKCFFEQLFLIAVLAIVGFILSSMIPSMICKIVDFILNGSYYTVYNILKGICQIIWFILSLIIIIHIFKIRYLNYYDEVLIEENRKTENKKVESLNINQNSILQD